MQCEQSLRGFYIRFLSSSVAQPKRHLVKQSFQTCQISGFTAVARFCKPLRFLLYLFCCECQQQCMIWVTTGQITESVSDVCPGCLGKLFVWVFATFSAYQKQFVVLYKLPRSCFCLRCPLLHCQITEAVSTQHLKNWLIGSICVFIYFFYV